MKPSILIVEDELIIAIDLQAELTDLGYHVCGIAISVEEAIEHLNRFSPNLVLLDIRLQGKALGTEFGKLLLERGDIPFIYMTSHYDKITVEDAKKTRPNGYLVKPFLQHDLYVAVEMALNNYVHRKIDNPVEVNSAPSPVVPMKIKKIVQYIQENLDKKISLPELAEQSGWNMHHFARMFKKYIGQPPHRYIQRMRVDQARALLEESDLSVYEIAMEVGFDNHSHFSKVFKNLEGLSPDRFRKQSVKHSNLK